MERRICIQQALVPYLVNDAIWTILQYVATEQLVLLSAEGDRLILRSVLEAELWSESIALSTRCVLREHDNGRMINSHRLSHLYAVLPNMRTRIPGQVAKWQRTAVDLRSKQEIALPDSSSTAFGHYSSDWWIDVCHHTAYNVRTKQTRSIKLNAAAKERKDSPVPDAEKFAGLRRAGWLLYKDDLYVLLSYGALTICGLSRIQLAVPNSVWEELGDLNPKPGTIVRPDMVAGHIVSIDGNTITVQDVLSGKVLGAVQHDKTKCPVRPHDDYVCHLKGFFPLGDDQHILVEHVKPKKQAEVDSPVPAYDPMENHLLMFDIQKLNEMPRLVELEASQKLLGAIFA